ncbi:MAG: threonylcarbamoyl-AMP synthase [Oscillospiraceae bacterium]|nr:threonylcarbamoyl-AMP synthase [Oscillospiraceae bacterium]
MRVIKDLTDKNLDIISKKLIEGDVVAIPTETVYGLAANALNPSAVSKIFKIKGRPSDNPLIVHISGLDMIKKFAIDVPDIAYKLAEKFWPGPLTIILKKSNIVPDITTGGLGSVALRAPAHESALKIIRSTNLGLAAPSANISGKPSPTTASHCQKDLGSKIDIIVDGGPCNFGIESTVVSLLDKTPCLLRPGVITQDQIKKITGKLEISKNILEKYTSEETLISPGMKYKHYAPDAEVILIKSNLNNFINYINKIQDKNCAVLIFKGEEKNINKPYFILGSKDDFISQSQNLFRILREIDETDFKKIYVRCPEISGVGLAVYNRLIRAANFNIINIDD